MLQGSKNIPAAASLFNEKPVGLFGDKPVRRGMLAWETSASPCLRLLPKNTFYWGDLICGNLETPIGKRRRIFPTEG